MAPLRRQTALSAAPPSSLWDGPCPRIVPAAYAERCLGLHQILQPPCVHHQGPNIRALDRLLDA